ncbi:MAG TPA: tetratricopeptide repeat protein, partial [Roseiflexaceae bacterium]|nr:tetratricopeptide repeat protein [Roseiflexaceae bacterium]
PAKHAQGRLLPAVRERLRHHSAAFLAELRPVVALMLHFQGIDYDHDADAGQMLNSFICAAQHITAHYEGALIDITMGDKGSYLYLTFGAPVAHDDDAARALAAARDLLALPRDLPYITAMRIGLARGTMHAGAYGGTQRRTYGVLGDPANLAARLMEAAPDGTAWCDYAVYHAAERRWAFAALPPVRVKGKASAVRVYEPLSERDQHAATSDVQRTMVGRQAEIAQLAAQLDDVAAGASRIFIVEGEAGIGKSRIVAELVQLLRARGMLGLLGAGKSVEQQTPYRAWRDIFSAYFGLDELTDAAARRARVQAYIAEHLPHLLDRAPILNDILSLDMPETDATRGFGPRLRRENLSGMLIELLRVWIAAQPLVVVLEDAHWLDSLSWELAVRLAQTAHAEHLPLFLMVTTRPMESTHFSMASLTTLLRHAGATRLKLGQLSPDDTVALAAARLGIDADAMPGELARLVQTQSDGNPFFAEELVTTLQEQEIIQVKPADDRPTTHMRCSIIGDLAQARRHMPDTLQGLLLARIDRLPPEQQLMLKVASVIGPVFDYSPLQHVQSQHVALDDAALKSSLRLLAARDFTQLEAPEPQLAYRFKHVLTQEAAYQTLLYTQRRALHRSAAEWYETTYAMQPSETLAPWHTLTGMQSEVVYVLAHHYRHAEDAERERHYAWLAGIHAADQFANTEAFAYFTRALELTPEHDFTTRYDILFEREAIEELLGMREAQARDLELLQELADALGDNRRRADVARNRARFAERIGNIAASRAFAVQAIALAEAAGATWIAIRSYDQLTWACIRAGNYDEARARAEAGLRIARASEDRSSEAQMLTALGCVYAEIEQYAMAQTCLSQSQHIFHDLNRHRGESVALGNLGEVMMLQGDYATAQNHLDRALHLYHITGDLRNEGWTLGNLGTSARHLGDYAAARAYYTEALAKSRAVEDRNTESAIMVDLAVLMHQLGNHAEALEQGVQALQRAVSKTVEARGMIVVGHALAGMARLDEARRYYADALTLAQASGLHAKAIEAQAGLARVALAGGDVAAAQAQIAHFPGRADLACLNGADEPFRV